MVSSVLRIHAWLAALGILHSTPIRFMPEMGSITKLRSPLSFVFRITLAMDRRVHRVSLVGADQLWRPRTDIAPEQQFFPVARTPAEFLAIVFHPEPSR